MPWTHVFDALNFSLAGAREGFGPFLGVYLQGRGFDPVTGGSLMAGAGGSGSLPTTPIGALIDRTTHKRVAIALAVFAIAGGSLLIVLTHATIPIAAGQVLIGIGDTAIAPLMAAVTLGVVGQEAFSARTARNEAFNHAGNAANALLAAALGYVFGLGYVALAIVVMAVTSSIVVNRLPAGAINHAVARSGEQDDRGLLRVFTTTPSLILLALTVMMFQTTNGAILPFLAQARAASGYDPSVTTGVMTVVGRLAMVGAALAAPRFAAHRGYAGVMSVVLATVIIRALLASVATTWVMLISVQLLEGLATGLAGVAIPALNATVMAGTGRANAGLGAVLTAFGIGATASPLLTGFVTQHLGYRDAFLTLAAVAGITLIAWTVARRRSTSFTRIESAC